MDTNRKIDLGRMERNHSDLYSHPHRGNTMNSQAKLAENDQPIYSEPDEYLGKKQIDTYQKSAIRKKLGIGFGVTGGVVFVGGVLGLAIWLATRPPPAEITTAVYEASTAPTLTALELQRVNCLPEAEGGVDTVSQEACEARSCIWNPSPFEESEGVPPCFFPQTEDFGYKVIANEDTPLGLRFYLERLTVDGIFGQNIRFVTFEVDMSDDNIIRFKFDVTDNNSRFKVPMTVNLGDTKSRSPRYEFQLYQTNPLGFRILRRSNGAVLWESGPTGLVYSDQFIQISTLLPSTNVYGFGENLHRSFRHDLRWKTWPMFARDQPPHSGNNGMDYNLYSVHPFYECVETDGQSHGVFLLNSNAMDYTFTPAPMLIYKTIGGILDFYMFLGPSPENVVQQYTSAIGRPYMPPYWSLGFQLARYGYKNLTEMQEAVDRTRSFNIPMDVQYADIDYMDERRDFTLDRVNWGGLPQYFASIRAGGIKTIIILDPPFEVNDTYQPYVLGLEKDLFIKWPNRGAMPEGDYDEYNRTDMMGYVWPPWKVVFPDFFNPDTWSLWSDLILELRQVIPFDGIWLDMNEPGNFDTNNDKAWNWPEDMLPYWTLKCPENRWDDPPFRPKSAYMYDIAEELKRDRLSGKTLCMVGVHAGGLRHYDVHSLYGHFQTEATLLPTRNAVGGNKRSLVVTRSTYPGSGAISGRWLGDNSANWIDMKLSIIGMLESNLFGIPYIGADICGFFGEPSPQLCIRWHQLGAFYPYARNHNHEDPAPQDPGAFGEEVAGPARDALNTRYTLLPYLYTLFHHAHTRGNTVVRPLLHEFTLDEYTWDIDEQFLWGPALLISPILEEDAKSLDLYLPRGRWYDYHSRQVTSDLGAELKTLEVDLATPIPLHVRGGYILPTQTPANNTQFSRRNPLGLLVALDEEDGFAEGDLFWDDGESIDTYENGNYHLAYFKSLERTLTMVVQYSQGVPEAGVLIFEKVEIMGASDTAFVYVNDVRHENFVYDGGKKHLLISGLTLKMNANFQVEWRDTRPPTLAESLRVNCCPEGCDDQICGTKNCIWNPVADVKGVPACMIAPATFGYTLASVGSNDFQLDWKGEQSIMGGDVNRIVLSGTAYRSVYRIKIFDPSQSRYEVPVPLALRSGGNSFAYEYIANPFGFRLGRSVNNMELLDTTVMSGISFSDKYLQISTQLASKNIYGLGEHMRQSFRHEVSYKSWPMFSRDQPPSAGANLYSAHPFIMCIESDGKAHGILFFNSNPQEIKFHPAPGLTYRTTGGIMDIYVMIGNTAENVIQQYYELLGYATIPPYWSLGFHLSRYGYDHIDKMEAAVSRTKAAGIPLESLFLDIDTFDERKDFTWDKDNFKGLPEYITHLHSNLTMKVVLILDPFLVSNESNYRPYDLGIEMSAFIKWPPGMSPDFDINNDDILLGWAWPNGRVVFPDYFKTSGKNFWKQLIEEYHRNELKFDGIWLDMNEPANFGTNEERAFNWPEEDLPYWTLKCPQSEWDDPIYRPRSIWGPRLSDKTICLAALQNNGNLRHYDVHSLYGYSQTIPTLEALRAATGTRSLVISRSTFPGSGRYAGHWLGDNASVWSALKQSIIGILDFNLFGIPLVGADICGYFGNATADMCQRWHQLGAFYTFARNHNGANNIDQDPASFGTTVAATTRGVMEVRYTLLPYLYTLFYQSSVSPGGTVIRPLLNEFSGDSQTWGIDEQFLWGKALLISPVIRPDKMEIYGYLPSGRWFDFYTGLEETHTGQMVVMNAPPDRIPLHVRGGYIIPTQGLASTTVLSRQEPFGLIVAPASNNRATGALFWDDGDGINTVSGKRYMRLTFSLQSNNVSSVVTFSEKDQDVLAGLHIKHIRVLGVGNAPRSLTTSPASETANFIYSAKKKELFIDDLGLEMSSAFAVWWS